MSKTHVPAHVRAATGRAAVRLHHLSMRYGGALVELARGQPVGLLPSGTPGLREARDIIDLALLLRAEVNALTALLVAAGIFSAEQFARQCTEQYDWLAGEKCAFLGCEVNDAGLVFTNPAPERK